LAGSDRQSAAVCALLGALAAGCGGGAALMHPAHTLAPQRVTMGAGVSNNFALGGADESIEAARQTTVPAGVPAPAGQQQYAEGAIVHTLVAPGLAPWVGARVGTGYGTDAGVTYTGRAARIDGRYALSNEKTALSFGLGASGILSHPSSDSGGSRTPGTARGVPGVDASGVTGWGLDVPIIAGYRSDAELVQIWGGLRGGYERLFGEILLRANLDQQEESRADVSAHRWFAGGLLGLAVGVRPFWVGIELDFAYQRLAGELDWAGTRAVEVEGFTLAPTGAVVGKF
jgi:hypothetical protein